MEKVIINPKEAQKGITLIALVITIIVLLILAGVSIAMLTGQNGILTQANNAKNETELASAKEKVELAVIGAISQTRDGTLTVGKLRTELANYGGTVEGNTFPVTATVDGKSFTVNDKGNVELAGEKQPVTREGIEVGDYVNGIKVLDIHIPRDIWEPIEIRVDSRYTNFILAEDIKTILTKEKMEANCYKVGGEDE